MDVETQVIRDEISITAIYSVVCTRRDCWS